MDFLLLSLTILAMAIGSALLYWASRRNLVHLGLLLSSGALALLVTPTVIVGGHGVMIRPAGYAIVYYATLSVPPPMSFVLLFGIVPAFVGCGVLYAIGRGVASLMRKRTGSVIGGSGAAAEQGDAADPQC